MDCGIQGGIRETVEQGGFRGGACRETCWCLSVLRAARGQRSDFVCGVVDYGAKWGFKSYERSVYQLPTSCTAEMGQRFHANLILRSCRVWNAFGSCHTSA